MGNSKSKEKSKKPSDLPIFQQRLRAWQPVLSPPWVITCFAILFLVFMSLGIVILISTLNIVEYEVDYTKACSGSTFNFTLDPNSKAWSCFTEVDIDIKKKMSQPIYMYYKLDNFYQNHRQYADSRNDQQLIGKNIDAETAIDSCGSVSTFTKDGDSSSASKNLVYSPCGLVAWSMFNDTISLFDPNDNEICNGANPDGTKCTKKGIAWSSDVDYKYKFVNLTEEHGTDGNLQYPNHYHNEPSHIIPKINDEDFIVWMRTAALPTFRKLYRIIKQDLSVGKHKLKIQYNYPTKPYKESASEYNNQDDVFKKKIVLSTTSWIGGKNLFLAIAYLSVAGLCLVLCGVFLVGALAQKAREKLKR